MKHILLVFIGFLMVSCGNEKTIQLPEIEHSEITEIHDVSAAYLFYDETQKDSIEFNRKNLIGTTNWLVNVDKRLTLKQAIPHIKYLQDKRRNAQMHKNENAKNYFTCNDTTRNNLGFIEFTDISFHLKDFTPEQDFYDQYICVTAFSSDSLNLSFSKIDNTKFNLIHRNNLFEGIKSNLAENDSALVYLIFDENLKFQDYISHKTDILNLNINSIEISNDEFIY